MSTLKLLKAIAEYALGKDFQKEMEINYQKRVSAGEYGNIEDEYTAALTTLQSSLTSEKRQFFCEYEATCTEIRKYSASYGFKAGMLCGFKQFFTSDHQDDGGFYQHVFSRISMMPQMCLHTENFNNIERKNKLFRAIQSGENETFSDCLLTVECTWSQRIYSACIDGFYCGYRGALAIIDTVMPLGHGSVQILSKLITMEHHLGFVKSYAQQEHIAAGSQ